MPRSGLTTTQAGYGHEHQLVRAELEPFVLAGGVRCVRCGDLIRPGEPWDLGHVDGDRSRYAGPEHARCNRATASRRRPVVAPEPEPERDGLEVSDERWRVPWLKGLRRVPRDAVWPRLMTVPHPAAVGSLGAEFIRWAERRSGRPLRWWQRLVAVRLLEVDAAGDLVWETMVLSLARQLGKSWLLRELCLWRIHQGGRFGEPQDVMHTGKDLAICKEVQRPARMWAKARPDVFKVREVNGQEEIELLADGSRWMLRAKEAVYGYAVSVAAADEAWKVRASSIEEGLVPTMVERAQPQLLLVSTAHRMASSLMLRRRQTALAQLEDGDGDLLIEWSAPAGAGLDDVAGWRLASPYWTPRRERLVAKQLLAARSGEIDDPEEPDPEQSFRSQWLNQWPVRRTELLANTEELLAPGVWESLAVPLPDGYLGQLWVAVEDDFGLGAAVAAAATLPDGRIEAAGWAYPDWDSALAAVERLAGTNRIMQLQVGASLLSRVPQGMWATAAGGREVRTGLPLLRDLAAGGMVVHDVATVELDEAIRAARVRESTAGLSLIVGDGSHLVRALVWAVQAAHRPAPAPAVY